MSTTAFYLLPRFGSMTAAFSLAKTLLIQGGHHEVQAVVDRL